MNEQSIISLQEDLLALMLNEAAEERDNPAGEIPLRPAGANLPLSFAQHRLWFLSHFNPHSASYHMPGGLRMLGHLDVDALRAALNQVVARHEALRTVFPEHAGEAVQVVMPELQLSLPVTDLSAMKAEERKARARSLAQESARQPFDLARGPVIRASLVKMAAQENILMFTLHHIVSDAWSIGLLIKEVSTLYAAIMGGWPAQLDTLPIQYADFAHWQRDWLSGARLTGQIDYWRRQLAAAPALLALPTDRQRPAVQRHRGNVHTFVLNHETRQGLHALAGQQRATVFMVLSAALSLLLARYSGEQDICLGTPVASRDRIETQSLIGLFVNTLVLRTQVNPHCSFIQLLEQVRGTALDAYANQDLPFEQLVEVLKPMRHLSYSPLFQVMLSLHNAANTKFSLPGLSLEPYGGERSTARYDLTLDVTDDGQQLQCSLEYDSDLFDASTVARMGRHLDCLLQSALARPHAMLVELGMMEADELAQLQQDWRATQRATGPVPLLPQLFAEQVARTPQAIAVLCGEEQLSYAELGARADHLAAHLRAAGIGPEMVVGVCLERSVNLLVALLAILKAGGAYLPLDPGYPSERLSYMLADTMPSLVLAQRHTVAGLVLPANVALHFMDQAWLPGPVVDAFAPLRPDSMAYVIYTSGSTGRPKGVMVNHGALGNFLQDMAIAPGLTSADCMLQLTSLSFDIAALELFLPLTVGARVVLSDAETMIAPRRLRALIERHGVTWMQATPATWRMLLAEGWPDMAHPLGVLCGGESLGEELAQQLLAHSSRVWNLYGPTETTIWSARARLQPADDVVTLGQAIANTRLYVLDEWLQPVAAGVAGELYIGGAGLARGYLRRPGLSAERFLPDPFADCGGARMYRTGDLVRYLADGRLIYMGRRDQQIKLRGFRIELGEIEVALSAQPEVSQAVVRVQRSEGGHDHLVAYLVPAGAATVNSAQLRSALQRQLPEYMVPSRFCVMDELPLTLNGKIDRNALATPSAWMLENPYVAPRTPTEEILCAMWAELLAREQVGSTDNFFELGGHSLLAMQLVSRLRNTFQLDLAVRTVFEAPTVAALGDCVDQLLREQGAGRAPAITAVARSLTGVLSFAQQRLWFLDQFEPDSAMYNMPVALRLRGTLDQVALAATINAIVARHEVLRTTFVRSNDQPHQRIAELLEVPLTLTDLSQLPHGEREARAQWLAQDEAQTPFSLEHGALIRCRLLRLAEHEHMVLFTLHHIVSDGWSMGVLVREVAQLYDAFVRGAPSPLPPLTLQYADFAYWQQHWLRGEALQRQLDYWTAQLENVPPLVTIRPDRPRPRVQTYRGAVLTVRLPAALTTGLYALSRRLQATLFMTAGTAFQILLARYTGQSDICMGTPIANRGRAEIESLIGFFVNTLVIRGEVNSSASFEQLVARTREVALAAYAHQDLPFEQLVEALKPQRDTSYSPLFQVMFAVQNAPMGVLQMSQLTMEQVPTTMVASKFDLSLDLIEGGTELHCQFEYNTDLYDDSTITRLAGHFQRVLEAVVADPQCAVGALPLLTTQEWQQLVTGWNDSALLLPAEPVHRLFEAQAARTPAAPAVVMGATSLSYAELNCRANQLASRLRSAGVGPDVLVGVCLDRTERVIETLLAVLKAGGAYLPLDPGYPPERLAYMLDDARPQLVVTDSRWQAALGASGLPLWCLDGLEPEVGCDANLAPHPVADAADLAYVIYTSGSTGRPKGVMIEQRQLSNLAQAQARLLLEHGSRSVLQFASINFDMSVEEIFPALLSGAQLVIRPAWMVAPDPEFVALLERHAVDTLNLPVAFWHEWVAQLEGGHSSVPACVQLVAVGGEKVNAQHHRQWTALMAGRAGRLINAYGPTESTVNASYFSLALDAACAYGDVPIGRPATNTQLYVLDAACNPVPVGVTGELYIAGAGLARGYLRRPGLTAERFLPNPFTHGERMYRSGDLVRYLADGNIEYLGRADNQVKIRGFRIELGEIEAVIASLPAVAEVAVLAREDAPGAPRLVAYVVAQRGGQTEVQAEQVERWSDSFDRSYGVEHAAPAGKFDIIGWNSSYDRQPIVAAEMQEWVQNTVDRIAQLQPRQVLEIGCGTGLLLHRLAPHCERYHGTDLSAVVLNQLQQQIGDAYPQCDLQLRHCAADQFDSVLGPLFDTVIINSVAQYFPDLDYLDAVLDGAVRALDQGGKIFVGDMRQLGLHEVFHVSLALFQADPAETLSRLRETVARTVRAEPELLVDPYYFLALRQRYPQISQVEIVPKLALASNEMSKYRYDVVLTLGGSAEAGIAPAWMDWSALEDGQDGLERLLAHATEPLLALRDIPRGLLAPDLSAWRQLYALDGQQCVAQLRDTVTAQTRLSLLPGQLLALGAMHGYLVQLSAACSDEGTFHAVLSRQPVKVDWLSLYDDRAVRRCANTPSLSLSQFAIQDQVFAHLRQQLPEYMIPAHLMVLDRMPLNKSGKLDTKTLPAPETQRTERNYVMPQTATEISLAAIWSEVLKLDRVGKGDNFFLMGGHSLMATQVIYKLRTLCEVELPLRVLFESPTLEELAQRIDALQTDGSDLAGQEIVRVSRENGAPLSFAQQRLWFLDQLSPLGGAYNMPAAVRLTGELNLDALRATINEVIRRHEVLRSTIVTHDGQPVQMIASALVLELPLIDLAGLAPDERERQARALAAQEGATGFDLAAGPLIRASLLRLAPKQHLVLFTLHHIVFDGWSSAVLVKEVAAIYTSFVQALPSPLAELPVQYADFAHWQRQWLASGVLAQQLAYWRRQLANAPVSLDLPMDRPRPVMASNRGASLGLHIGAGTTAGLYAVSRQAQATLFMTLSACFSAMLARLSGQDDICLGTPIANRNRSETAGLIGFFVNTLVLRNRVRSGMPFIELLQHAREVALDAFANQDIPFEQLVETLNPDRQSAHSPLFQVMLALHNTPAEPLVLPGLTVEPYAAESNVAKFDLSLDVTEADDTLHCQFEYNTDLFDRTTIQRMAGHFERLLEAVVADPRCAVGSLPLLTTQQWQQLVTDWNDSALPLPAEPVHRLFEAQAARTPAAPAVVMGTTSLSYAELNCRANQLASRLRSAGVGPDVLVGVCLDRSERVIETLLAVLKAGGAYLPLDPGYPPERLVSMLDDARPQLVLTDSRWQAGLGASGLPLWCLDALEPEAGCGDNLAPHPQASVANLAYVIYTSGSTGRPKGVMIEQRQMSNLVQAQARLLLAHGSRSVLQFASMSFDASVEDIFSTLLTGAQLVIRPAWMMAPDAQFVALIQQHAIDTLDLPVAFWHEWVAQLDAGQSHVPASVQLVVVGGEKVNAQHHRRWAELLAGRTGHWINSYGPTESTVNASYFPLPLGAACCYGDVPIGRPAANTRLYVLDAAFNPVPVGVTGELYIAGAGLARGYLRRPGLTAERFLPNPFTHGERMYRSGDLVRYLADGNIEYLGRADNQVKIRGFRIELGEIESVIAALPGVAEVAVLAREDVPGDQRLVAYVVTQAGAALDEPARMRALLAKTLPEYMIPAAVVALAELPRNVNGKIDRAALPAQAESSSQHHAFIMPRTATEARVAEIWADILRVQQVGASDDFFLLGGHSLLAAQAMSRLRQAFGIDLPLRRMFESSTVEAMAALIEQENRGYEEIEI